MLLLLLLLLLLTRSMELLLLLYRSLHLFRIRNCNPIPKDISINVCQAGI